MQGKYYSSLVSGIGAFIIACVLFLLMTINFTGMLQKYAPYLAYYYMMSALAMIWAIISFRFYVQRKMVAFYEDHARAIDNNEDVPYYELYLGPKKGTGFEIYSKQTYENPENTKKPKVKPLWFIKNNVITKKGCLRYDWLSKKMEVRS